MRTQAAKAHETKSQRIANVVAPRQRSGVPIFQLADNRPDAIAQRKFQKMANNSPRVLQLNAFQDMANNSPQAKQVVQLHAMINSTAVPPHPIQQKASPEQSVQSVVKESRKENNTGLPDTLKTGIEHLSGMSLDDVKVHRNSDKPAQLQAHAYAQGTDIHLGPGQEKHLPHEAWHVVQQKQGRVKPTIQMKAKINVIDVIDIARDAGAVLQREPIIKDENDADMDIGDEKKYTIEDLKATYKRVKKMKVRDIIETEIERRKNPGVSAPQPEKNEIELMPPKQDEIVHKSEEKEVEKVVVEINPDKVTFDGEFFVQDGAKLGAAEISLKDDTLTIDWIEVYSAYQGKRLSYLFLWILAKQASKGKKPKIKASVDVASAGNVKVAIYEKSGMDKEALSNNMVVNPGLSAIDQASALKIKDKWGLSERVKELAWSKYLDKNKVEKVKSKHGAEGK